MTPEEVESLCGLIVEAFRPFITSLVTAYTSLAEWANENRELFERINKELDRLKEKEGD